MPLASRAWWQVAAISAAALGVYAGIRQLAGAGSSLSHHDFRAPSLFAPEFCDPDAPAFIPIERVRGAVVATLEPAALVGPTPARLRLRLETASGRPVGPLDILESHTQLVHVLAVDAGLGDYQHLHPEPVAGEPGLWEFTFAPRVGGDYRMFLDFTPRATARGLYALVDLPVSGLGLAAAASPVLEEALEAEVGGVRFAVTIDQDGLREGRRGTLTLTVRDPRGLELEPVMGALAHVVAFDPARSGVAHLHPLDAAGVWDERRTSCALTFSVAFPAAGWFRLWAQTHAGGAEQIAPFTVRVKPRI